METINFMTMIPLCLYYIYNLKSSQNQLLKWIFFLQARKLKDSLCKISDGIQEWASKTLLVAGAYRKLADLINDTPTQLTESKVFSGMLTAGTKLWQMNLHFLLAINFSMHGSPSLFLLFLEIILLVLLERSCVKE